MIVSIEKADLFSSPAETICVTVNLVGVMGCGVARQALNRFPGIIHNYKACCDSGKLQIGKLLLYEPAGPKNYLLFPTKKHFKNDSKLEWVEAGLIKLASTYKEKGIKSVAVPALGCGHGNLNWDEVLPLIKKHLEPIDLEVYIYV